MVVLNQLNNVRDQCVSSQSREYKKTLAIQMDLNWDGDPSIEPEEEEKEKISSQQKIDLTDTSECQAQN
tara:strand:+ start:1184 stop:1390 length:207 start_codon:yes stop_codon:yes gene_type:complete